MTYILHLDAETREQLSRLLDDRTWAASIEPCLGYSGDYQHAALCFFCIPVRDTTTVLLGLHVTALHTLSEAEVAELEESGLAPLEVSGTFTLAGVRRQVESNEATITYMVNELRRRFAVFRARQRTQRAIQMRQAQDQEF